MLSGLSQGETAHYDLVTLCTSPTGFRIVDQGSLSFADSVAVLDFNGDGVLDIAVGSRARARPGTLNRVVVVFNPGTRAQALIEMDKLWDTNQSIALVSKHGDINGDGIDDLAIGTTHLNTAYVVYGSREAHGVIDLSAAAGITIEGARAERGVAVHGPGDLNSDNVDDVAVGAYDAGTVYVVYGSKRRAAKDPHFGVCASRFVEYTLQYSNMRATSEGNELPWPLDEPTEGYDSHSSPQWSEWFFFDETQLCPTYVVEVKAITNTRIEANEGM
eukprot:m51a1_g4429 hypothetical protein (274) ;mRNA; r:65921-68939